MKISAGTLLVLKAIKIEKIYIHTHQLNYRAKMMSFIVVYDNDLIGPSILSTDKGELHFNKRHYVVLIKDNRVAMFADGVKRR